MKKKKPTKATKPTAKLRLKTQKVRSLQSDRLGEVGGGAYALQPLAPLGLQAPPLPGCASSIKGCG